MKHRRCVSCGKRDETVGIVSQPTAADGRHVMALCGECLEREMGIPNLPPTPAGGYITQPCPVCGAPEGLFFFTVMMETGGTLKCQACGELTRHPRPAE